MKRSKTMVFSLGLSFFIIIIMIATFASQKEDDLDTGMESQEVLQETEWQMEEDDETAAGSNLFYGNSMAEGNNSFYVLDTGRYGGRPADENAHGYIYQKKEGEWGVFVDDAPSGMYDINEISNLVYMDGYIYFALKHVAEGESYIYRVPEEEGYKQSSGVGTLEWISPCDVNFYVYNGEIYFKYHDYRRNGRRCFYKVSLNGEDEEELYSDDQKDTSESDYTVGGGCLYLKDGEQVLGINLETGERKGFETDAEHIDGLFYEHGSLYIYDSANGQVYQMDVRTGSESKLIEGKILSDCVWVHDGWLYYVEGVKEQEAFCCDLKAVNLTTKEILLWKSVPFDRQPCDAGLEVVEGRIMADFCVINENETKEYTYLEKEVREITDAEYKESIELTDKEKEEGQIKTIVIQDGFREGKWQVAENGDEAILGDDLSSTSSAEGNGCIYSTNPRIYDGEPPEEGEDNGANIYSYNADIYRLKDGKWELFASHPATEEDDWDTGISVYNLAYYNGYLYYILLWDYDPYSGAGDLYTICRIPEQGGTVEKLAECNGNFFIYQDRIYYDDPGDGMKRYFRMKPDGSDKELIYFENLEGYQQFSYAVGGGCLYIWESKKDQMLEINLETGLRREFGTDIYSASMVYEAGNLYFINLLQVTGQPYGGVSHIIWQMDVATGNVKTLIGERCAGARIHEGYMYYVEWEEQEEDIVYYFKAMNLETGECVQWDSITSETYCQCVIKVLNDQVIIGYTFIDENATGWQYFKKEISEIMEMEWRR